MCFIAILTDGSDGTPHATSCMNFSSLFKTASQLQTLKKKNDNQHQLIAAVHDEVADCEEYSAAATAAAGLQAVLVAAYFVITYLKRKCGGRFDVESSPAPLQTRADADEIALSGREPVAEPTSYERLLAVTNTALYIRDGVLIPRLPGQDGPNGEEHA